MNPYNIQELIKYQKYSALLYVNVYKYFQSVDQKYLPKPEQYITINIEILKLVP